MKKTVIAPGQGPIESDELDEPPVSFAIGTHHRDHVDVETNGLVYPDGGVREQTREILGLIEKMLEDLDGDTNDVTKLRMFVRVDHYGRETRGAILEVVAEFFDRPHYPTGCLVAVPDLLDGAIIEIEAKAIIPEEGWTVEAITGDE